MFSCEVRGLRLKARGVGFRVAFLGSLSEIAGLVLIIRIGFP